MGANLLEGAHRGSRPEFARFLCIARGSCAELKYHLLLSRDLSYIDEREYSFYMDKLDKISALLYGLYKSLTANGKR